MTFGDLLEHFANKFENIIVYSETDNIEDVFHEDDDEDKETLKRFYPYIVDNWCCCNRDNILSVSIHEECEDV